MNKRMNYLPWLIYFFTRIQKSKIEIESYQDPDSTFIIGKKSVGNLENEIFVLPLWGEVYINMAIKWEGVQV